MSNIARRRIIEERIVRASQSVKQMSISKEDWPDEDEIQDYLDVWDELVQYYQEFEDSLLDIEVVREYADSVHLLYNLKNDIITSDQRRDQIEEVLEELEGNMAEVIKEAVTNKYG